MFQERDLDDFLVGVQEHSAKGVGLGVEVYPNPFEDEIYMTVGRYDGKTAGGRDILVKVLDLEGRVLMERSFGDDLLRIDASNWAPGVYILHATIYGQAGYAKVIKK